PETEATRTFWDAMRDEAENRAARTRNRAGYGALQEEMGREESRRLADVVRRGRLIGVDILGQLYGGSTGLLSSIYGQRASLANQPGFWDQLALAGIGGAGQAGAAYFGRPG
ncbi:MAG: hypothetical protein L0Z53_16775, partial [Acidobacteriales bacterium]|nr:hypothetical protein [Terriglobales bacterium]